MERDAPIDFGIEILGDFKTDSVCVVVETEVKLKTMWEVRTSMDNMLTGFIADENGKMDSGTEEGGAKVKCLVLGGIVCFICFIFFKWPLLEQ